MDSDQCDGVSKLLSKAKMCRDKLRSDLGQYLCKLSEIEWNSLIFLVLDEDSLVARAFNYYHYVHCGKFKEVVGAIERRLRIDDTAPARLKDNYDLILEALYRIGRHDILVDDLELCLQHDLEPICEMLCAIPPRRLDVYRAFVSMTQKQADHLVGVRLPTWHCPAAGEQIEITFCRNLTPRNFSSLIIELYNGLRQDDLAFVAYHLERYVPLPQEVLDVSTSSGTYSDECYPMAESQPHGLCLIINVKNFMPPRTKDDHVQLDVRHGSDIDQLRLEGTFKLFGFNVIRLNDPDYEQLCSCFARLRTDSRLYSIACLAVCIMTHGDEDDNLYLHDRTCIPVTDLRKLCYAQALIDKPRLYFVQACRGEQSLRPVFLQRDSLTTASNSESDCLISAATVRGYSAMRSQSSGSWYITDLCSCLQEFGLSGLPLRVVLMKTRERLQKRVDKYAGGYVTQISEDKSTLIKDVYLKRAEESLYMDGILDLVMLELMEELIDAGISEVIEECEDSSFLSRLESNLIASE